MPAMSNTLFKFTKLPEGITRRVLFTSSPSWDELAAKIESLYDIPKHDVGVSYTDNDGDEVTLSTNGELQDFYEFNAPSRAVPPGADAMKAIRFTVRDLSSARSSASEADKPLPETPRSSIPNFRNTFGASSAFPGTVFETGLDDWQDVQRFSSAPPYVQYSPEPHTFVEPVESDVSISRDADKEDTASSVTMSDVSTGKADKGKGKAATVEDVMDEDDDIRSTVSMLASSAPTKPPIHVASHASSEDIFGTAKAAAASTPSINRDATPKPAEPQAAPEVDDPPLPELEDIPNPQAQAGPSLANDVANLLSTFSNVFVTHPELSEGIRNIVQNATSGVYWAAHREAVARAAEDVRRSAQGGAQDAQRAAEEAHRAAEEAAGRRVAEALGGVMRAIGQVAGGLAGGASEAANPARNDEPVTSTPIDANRPGGIPRGPSSLHRNGPLPFGGAWLPPPPPPPPFPDMFPPPSPPRDSLFHMLLGQLNPPAPPQLLPHFMPPPPPPMNIPGAFPGAGTPPLPHPHRGRHWQHHPHRHSWADFSRQQDDSAAMDVDGAGSTQANAPESAAAPRDENREASSKAALLAAKQRYKNEKERYRQERAMRREVKERRKNTSGERCADSDSDMSEEDGSDSENDSSKPPPKNSAKDDENQYMEIPAPQEPADAVLLPVEEPEEEAQIVSNARGRFPQLEMFPVSPRRHHTFSGRGIGTDRGRGRGGFMHHHHHPHHSHIPPLPPAAPFPGGMFPPPPPPPHTRMPNPFMNFMNSGTSRNAENIMRRLSDMGFTQQDYPALAGKVNARAALYQGADISKDIEDTVVAEILEELLASKADESQAEGSNLRRSNTTSTSVPGAWV